MENKFSNLKCSQTENFYAISLLNRNVLFKISRLETPLNLNRPPPPSYEETSEIKVGSNKIFF